MVNSENSEKHMLENLKPKKSLITLIGLLDQIPHKNFKQYCNQFEKFGYVNDFIDPHDTLSKQIVQDLLYPDFRKIMFSDVNDTQHVRLKLLKCNQFRFKVFVNDSTQLYSVSVVQSELYLFRGYIGLFSLKIELEPDQTIGDISNVLNKIRNFNTRNIDDIEWHAWITDNFLAGVLLRSTADKLVSADEYSGSKFKLFTAYDLELEQKDRQGLLYDMATVSPISSGIGLTAWSPDSEYYDLLMKNRVAAFKNWEAIALFDGFCALGTGFLLDHKGEIKKDWDITYFRLYLFRLFFKYNLYRFSTLISNAEQDQTVEYRDQFEDFLNHYNISHISFNFLPNLIFDKMGNALELEREVEMFRERIKNLSSAIQEAKQAKTNKILQLVTALSGLGVLADINNYLQQFQEFTNITMFKIYMILVFILITAATGVYYYLEPEKFKKWFARK